VHMVSNLEIIIYGFCPEHGKLSNMWECFQN
jgi:hypothetical protein